MKNLTEMDTKNLIIEMDQMVPIAPALHLYDSIHIKERGLLKVSDNGSNWLVLKVKKLTCDGTIEYINFKRNLGSVSHILGKGKKLEHTYIEALGGNGGNGSGNNYKQGGIGFKSNDFNGGGGGSGSYYTSKPEVNVTGINATDFRGAPSPNSSSICFGGNGGRQSFGHGGLICIIADKIVFGPSAKIILNGSNGADGSVGGKGGCGSGGGGVRSYGGGGGGGGTSGGNGGVLIIKSRNVINLPQVNVNPGIGGKFELGGISVGCSFDGQVGENGEDGAPGLWSGNNVHFE